MDDPFTHLSHLLTMAHVIFWTGRVRKRVALLQVMVTPQKTKIKVQFIHFITMLAMLVGFCNVLPIAIFRLVVVHLSIFHFLVLFSSISSSTLGPFLPVGHFLRLTGVWTHDEQPVNMWQKQYDYRGSATLVGERPWNAVKGW